MKNEVRIPVIQLQTVFYINIHENCENTNGTLTYIIIPKIQLAKAVFHLKGT